MYNQLTVPGSFLETIMFDPANVTASIASLYDDQLKPFGRILRKRVAERMQASGHEVRDVDADKLKAQCDACPWLLVELEEGGDWCVLIAGRQPDFVDAYSPHDRYSPQMWSAASAYFASLSKLKKAAMSLPGGRYSCALALASRGLAFLQGRSLGEICHIVQLAISQKKLLGYSNGTVVPYSHSQSRLKESCADRRRPVASTRRGEGPWPLATWDSVRACLREIFCSLLMDPTSSSEALPISNIKTMFRSRFRLELSETALGHSKLSELLQDPRVADICTVKLLGHGYIAIPQQHISMPSAPRSSTAIRLADQLPPPLPMDWGNTLWAVDATSVPVPPPISFPFPLICSGAFGGPCQLHVADYGVYAGSQHSCGDEASNAQPVMLAAPPARVLKNAHVGSIVKNGFIELASTPLTPVPGNSRFRAHSVPKDIGSNRELCEPRSSVPHVPVDPCSQDLDWETAFPETACRRSTSADEVLSNSHTPLPTTPAWLFCSTPSMLSPAPVSSELRLHTTASVDCIPRAEVLSSPAAKTPAYVFCSTPSRSQPPTPSKLGLVGGSLLPQEFIAYIGSAPAAQDVQNELLSQTPASGQRFCPDDPLTFDDPSAASPAPSVIASPSSQPDLSAVSRAVAANGCGTIASSKAVGGKPRARRASRLPPRWKEDDDDVSGFSEISKPEPPSPALTASPVYCYYEEHYLPSPCSQMVQMAHCAAPAVEMIC